MKPSSPTHSEPRAGSEQNPANLPGEPVAKRHGTLPPPEWVDRHGPRSSASIALESQEADQPVGRRIGSRAELAFLEARIVERNALGDTEGERAALMAVCRALGAQGAELELATKLARRALLLGDEPTLREEVSGWLAGIGDPALAAATLRPLAEGQSGAEALRTLTRVAVLLARAGDATGAAEAFAEAVRHDAEDPIPAELLASVAGWAPEVVSRHRAAALYLDAFARREAKGEKAPAFAHMLCAFEAAPDSAPVADRLAALLISRGRALAADEVRRQHANASGEAGRSLHLVRMRDAARDGDIARALGAALDAGLDAALDIEGALSAVDVLTRPELALSARTSHREPGSKLGIDELFERAGLHEVFAARLEFACDRLRGTERARVRLALARLYAGPLASAERAVDAWLDALAADSGSEEAKASLRAHAASTRDEALDEELRGAQERLGPLARLQDEALREIRALLDSAAGPDRAELLRRAAALLRGRPDEVDAYVEVLSELVQRLPDERAWQASLERVLGRHGRLEELERVLLALVKSASESPERDRARLALSAVKRRQGDAQGALDELRSLLEHPGAHARAWSMALVLAAHLGDDRVRAEALLRIASPLAPPLRAVLTSVAAELLLTEGDLGRAREAANVACHADPSLARPVAVRAQVALAEADPAGAQTLERAMAFIVPRADLCRGLADAYAKLGDRTLAFAWTQRELALSPGSLDAAAALLSRVIATSDANRLADVLAWLFTMAQPLHELAEPIANALRELARLDADRALGLSRRAIDVLGPKGAPLRAAVLAVADAIGEPGLGIAVLERWLAAGCAGADRGELLLEIAKRRRQAADPDGAARALCRALTEGAEPALVRAELKLALPAKSSDGELGLLAARAVSLDALPTATPVEAARAFRELGAARWDLASDRQGALAAWERAAALDPERGIVRLARDLVHFGGHSQALAHLQEFAERCHEPAKAAAFYASAAAAALHGGLRERALELAESALELDPGRADVLAVAEHAATALDIDVLERIYNRVAEACLGWYGERAVHYRAARQLEKRGEHDRALRHAIRAFEAVPSEGVAYVLMARLAERTELSREVARALTTVASRSSDAQVRSAWLCRAALFTGDTEDGKRQRVELLLRALAVRADVTTMRLLGQACAAVVELVPEDKDIVEMRFARALDSVLPTLDGPEGARIAVEAARVALTAFDSAKLALRGLSCALSADGDIDEFAALTAYVPRFGSEPEAARAFVRLTVEKAAQPFASVGRPILELALCIANEFDDESELVTRLVDAIPENQRVTRLLEMARNADRDGDLTRAIEALERALSSAGLDDADRAHVLSELRQTYARAGRRDELERLLAKEAARSDLEPGERVRTTRDLAALIAARGDPERALEILSEVLNQHVDDEGLLSDMATLARQTGEKRRQAAALARLADLARDVAGRSAHLRELAPLLEDSGDSLGALARWSELLKLDPHDVPALAALERDAESRGDYETLATLLARRAAQASLVDDVRRIRLRRATLLEQRLGRPDEARAELEALLASTGDNLSVLRVLSDLNERLGMRLRAAPLWLRASAVARDRSEASDLARRACEAYLDGDDVESALRVLEDMRAWAQSPELMALKVEVERKRQHPLELAESLDELAAASIHTSVERAALLCEAARASLAGTDEPAALSRAQRAARLAAGSAECQLLARWLEYLRRGGPGSVEQARVSIAELRGIDPPLKPHEVELSAFLVAEALDTAVGVGAGMRELTRAHAEVGPRPLIAVATAERLVSGGEHARALPLFDAAISGDLQRVRTHGEVAMSAARAARAAGEIERALGYLELAAKDTELRAEALGLQAEMRDVIQPHTAASAVSEAAPPHASQRPTQNLSDVPAAELETDEHGQPLAFPPATRTEALLLSALANSSVRAGKELMQQLENRSDRSHDLVAVCRRVAVLLPGDRWTLDKLHDAAVSDRNPVYARALEHVLRAFQHNVQFVEPPPLQEQAEQPEWARAMLFREALEVTTEALALVWEGAEHVFRRDPATYRVTGLERVPYGAPHPLARAYSTAVRALGMTRTPLFQRRNATAVTVSVALLSPPALILAGDVRYDSPELRFHLGAMLAATLAPYVLLFGLPEPQVRAVLKALGVAFGSSQQEKANLASAYNLAEVLWESIPVRSQRRLRELCDDPGALSYEAAIGCAKTATRRAGLFVSGDLTVAVRETCADENIATKLLEEPDGLQALCSASPAVADLVRLATSPEYAETRWQPGGGGKRQTNGG